MLHRALHGHEQKNVKTMVKKIEIRMDGSKTLKTLFEIASSLIDEANVYFTPGGLEFFTVDSSHVGMAGLKLPKEFFSSFSCKEECKLGLDLNDMVKILRRGKAGDELALIQEEDSPKELHLQFKSTRSTRTFKLKSRQIHADENEQSICDTFMETLADKWNGILHIDGAMMDEIIKDASIISDLVKIIASKSAKMVNFLAWDECGELEVDLDIESDAFLDTDLKNDCSGLYSINFLKLGMKIKDISNTLELRLGKDVPLLIRGDLGNGGIYNYLLAPRVEDDDDEFTGDTLDEDELDDIDGELMDDIDAGIEAPEIS